MVAAMYILYGPLYHAYVDDGNVSHDFVMDEKGDST